MVLSWLNGIWKCPPAGDWGDFVQVINKDPPCPAPGLACSSTDLLLTRPEPKSSPLCPPSHLSLHTCPCHPAEWGCRRGTSSCPYQLCPDTRQVLRPHPFPSLILSFPPLPPLSLAMFLLSVSAPISDSLSVSPKLSPASLSLCLCLPPSLLPSLCPSPLSPRDSIHLVPAVPGPLYQLSFHLASSAL